MKLEPAEQPPLADNVEQASPAEVAELLRFSPGDDFSAIDTAATPGFSGDKAAGKEAQAIDHELLSDLQERLYANANAGDLRKAVLLVLQGRDTAGKGGVVKHVVGALSPHGMQVAAFGVPTEEEASHHFLWRIYRALPKFGNIGVFDRSHYEDILAVRMHKLRPPSVWLERYDTINGFEDSLTDSGIHIVKCMLTVSQEEQADRLENRLRRVDKHWKYNSGDVADRARWSEYTQAYQDVLDRTSTDDAPWYVIPADRKWYSRWAIVRLLINELQKLDLDWPLGDFDPEEELRDLKETNKQFTD
ncbi:polyphosphate kinase 2 family protein [Brevibacterium luteolum]|uniref:PPK2 family polyphosphate kinase n=1 Tax=Brevibacterium luteolum TaxID=199591 RepID=UPI00223A9ADF|nr:PPK2 family polyphosphate kinase [Brevibacterium luteolum]MCT1921800.1 polyphosphate kinase 2 family protein [Brevibacterium luteolum]